MQTKKKISFLQIYRIVIQILLFILLPGLYASTFLDLKTFYLGVMNGNLDFTTYLLEFIETLAVISITLLLGRFFCGWMCAFGAICDWLYAISKKMFKIKFKIPEKTDRILKYFKYVYLIVLTAFLWHVDWGFLKGTNPWDAFGYIFTIKDLPDIPGAFQYFAFGTILLILILMASMVIERFFCRYLCPLGAVFAILSRFRILKIKKVHDKCGACRICTNNCPMGIPLYKYDKISTGECIQCLRCTSVCPRKNTQLTVADEKVNAILAGTVVVAVITSISYTKDALAGSLSGNSLTYESTAAEDTNTDTASTDANTDTTSTDAHTNTASTDTHTNTASTDANTNTTSTDTNTNTTTSPYSDGTYEGSGTGFRNNTTIVSITISGGLISDIAVISYGDTRQFFSRAYNTIVSEILDKQLAKVDTVSGATFSSRGIMSAVEDALNSAVTSS